MKISGVDGRVSGVEELNSSRKIENPRRAKQHNDSGQKEVSAVEMVEKLKSKIDELNEIVNLVDRDIVFRLHDETRRLMTQVVDTRTGEVIKEIPPEEMLDLVARIHEMVGIIIDEKV